MESESRDGFSLSTPLLLNQKQNELEVEANGNQTSTSTTSLLKTCFDGLNALSG
jgi:hypothetical protein